MTEDVSNLPEGVLEIQRELEKYAFCRVVWVEDREMRAAMQATWGEDGETPTVRYSPGRFSHAGAAEELLHLRLDQVGYPRLYRPGANWAVCGAGTLLQNLLQHQIIYPQIRALGLLPGTGECRAASRLIESRLEKSPEDVARCEQYQLVAVTAVIYICSRVYCSPDALPAIDAAMNQIAEVAEARQLGARLLPQFDLNERTTDREYGDRIESIIAGLGLSGDLNIER